MNRESQTHRLWYDWLGLYRVWSEFDPTGLYTVVSHMLCFIYRVIHAPLPISWKMQSAGLFIPVLVGHFTINLVMVKTLLRDYFYLKFRVSQKVHNNIKMSFLDLSLDKVNFFLRNLKKQFLTLMRLTYRT